MRDRRTLYPSRVFLLIALGACSGCAENSGWWDKQETTIRRAWQNPCKDEVGELVAAAGIVVVAVVIGTGLAIVNEIRLAFQDGSGGVAWDSEEGYRLRHPVLPPRPGVT